MCDELQIVKFGDVDVNRRLILQYAKEGFSNLGRFIKVHGTPEGSQVRGLFGATNAVNLDTMRPAMIDTYCMVKIVGSLAPVWK